eukprot:g4708.t1
MLQPTTTDEDSECHISLTKTWHLAASASPSGAHTHAAADCKFCKYHATATPSIV